MALGKADIFNRNDLSVELVPVPEWGGEVYVRTLRSEERDAYEASVVGDEEGGQNLVNLRGRFAALVICDADGNRIFTDDDAPELGRKNAAALARVVAAGQRLAGMGKGSVEKAAGN